MPEVLSSTLLPALGATLFFGVSVLVSKQGLRYVDAQTGSMISIGTTTLIYCALAPFLVKAEYFRNPGVWVFIANGCIHPLISMAMGFEATRRLGATVSSTVSSVSPWFTTLGAVLLLGERPGFNTLLGTLATVGGILVLTWRGRGKRTWPRSALWFAVAAAVVRATNNLIGKVGLGLLPVPFMAAWVSFSVSLTGSVLVFRLRHGRLPLRLPREGLKWFSLTGLCITAAILCMYTALGRGQVAVVSPIISAYPILTLLGSLALGQEVLDWRIVTGVLITVGGVVLIGL